MITNDDNEEPSPRLADLSLTSSVTNLPAEVRNGNNGADKDLGAVARLLGFLRRHKSDDDLREALEEYIEDDASLGHIGLQERLLIANVMKLRDTTVVDVMIPRVDIVALDIETSQAALLSILAEKQFSRFPVYRETLDDVVGTIHIKDILASLAQNKPIEIINLVRDVPIVSPSMQIIDLILMMKKKRKHMALVVDEYGGIDGLVTIGDVIEAIIGEIEDEYDTSEEPAIIKNKDGSFVVDGRLDIEEFEKEFGAFLTEDEREDIDTLGGLVFAVAGHIPARGEVLTHPAGLVFEILDADPRRVNKVLVKQEQTLNSSDIAV